MSSCRSSRLYQSLVKEQQVSNMVDAFISGTTDPGLLIIEGKPSQGKNIGDVSNAIWKELTKLQETPLSLRELQKIKNKAGSNLIFSETSALNKAMSLAYYEYLDDIDLINTEVEMYQNITDQQLMEGAQQLFDKEKVVTLTYHPKS